MSKIVVNNVEPAYMVGSSFSLDRTYVTCSTEGTLPIYKSLNVSSMVSMGGLQQANFSNALPSNDVSYSLGGERTATATEKAAAFVLSYPGVHCVYLGAFDNDNNIFSTMLYLSLVVSF